VKLSVKEEYWNAVGTTVGFDYTLPLDIRIKSDGTSKPKYESNGKPVANAHTIEEVTVGLKANIGITCTNAAIRFDSDIYWGFDMFSNPDTIQGHGVNAGKPVPSPFTRLGSTLAKREVEAIPLSESKNLFAVALTFTNRLGVSTSMGNLTHCSTERLPVEHYHEHSLHFSVYTLWLGKRWYFWRFKNILQCWFCQNCKLADLQRASDLAF
jgi:hypothetical protein